MVSYLLTQRSEHQTLLVMFLPTKYSPHTAGKQLSEFRPNTVHRFSLFHEHGLAAVGSLRGKVPFFFPEDVLLSPERAVTSSSLLTHTHTHTLICHAVSHRLVSAACRYRGYGANAGQPPLHVLVQASRRFQHGVTGATVQAGRFHVKPSGGSEESFFRSLAATL